MTGDRYVITLDELSGDGRVPLGDMVQEQPAPRLHEPMTASLPTPFGPEHGADGDGD